MVVIVDHQYEQWQARRFVRSLGVDEAVLRKSEKANPGVDWLSLTYALDRVFLSYGGCMAQSRFFQAPHESLGGETPLEVLAKPGGLWRVCRAAHAFAAAEHYLPAATLEAAGTTMVHSRSS